jgi:hypothetical protein
MNKPQFRPIAPLDADDAALERVNESLGVPTMLRPTAKAVTPPSRPAVAPSRRNRKLTFRAPTSVIDDLKMKALMQTTSVRTLILKALKDAGYLVIDEDLLPGAGGSD